MIERRDPAGDRDARRLSLARALFAERRRRLILFGRRADAFQEPAWDLLLLAFIAAGERQSLQGRAASTRIGIAETLGSRWIAHLVAEGLAERPSEIITGEAFSISRDGQRLMAAYLDLLLSNGRR